jgi:hypothetical protein
MSEFNQKKADDDEVTIESIKEEYGLDDKQADIVEDLCKETQNSLDDISNISDDWPMTVEFGREEYQIFEDTDSAKEAAKESIESLIDDVGITGINGWENYLDESKLEDYFREIYTEMDESYVSDMRDSEKFEILQEYGFIDSDVDYSDYEDDLDQYDDDLVESMVDSKIDEGEGGLSYYKSNFGDEEAANIAKDYVDMEAIVEYVIDTDGLGNTLSPYDGNEYDLVHDAMAFRQN